MNETINYGDLVPSLLVFEVLSIYTSTRTKIPVQQDRINSLLISDKEIESIVSKHRVQKYISSNVPFYSKYDFKPDDEVLLCHEKEKVKLVGLYRMKRIEESMLFIDRYVT